MVGNDKRRSRIKRKILTCAVILFAIPLTVMLGVWLFEGKRYNIISVIVALLSCLPFFWRFEKGSGRISETVIVAVMVAFSVMGRIIFAPIPSFKPVGAITIISGIALGPQAGFVVGSLSAVISNMFFGQGPWTPFQMLAWGITGYAAGLLFGKKEKPPKVLICILGVAGGVIYSLIMDIWTAISLDGELIFSRWAACVISSLWVTVIYAVSNVIFLLLLSDVFLSKLRRVKLKLGIFDVYEDK